MYEAEYPSKGDPKLARHVIDLLTSAGINAEGVKRGLDHGVWAGFHVGKQSSKRQLPFPFPSRPSPSLHTFKRIPQQQQPPATYYHHSHTQLSLLAFHPTENPLSVPLVQVSLFHTENPDQHYRLGAAVSRLRDEGVVIIGAGMSVHNLRDLWADAISDDPSKPRPYTVTFDEALREAVETKDPDERQMRMAMVCGRPDARKAHPTMDHLMPVYVAAGAAGGDQGRRLWTLHEGSMGWAQYRFGNVPGGGVSW